MGVDKNIFLGKILYLYVSFPHQEQSQNKFLVFVGIDIWPLLLKLNTEATQSPIAKKFKERQFKIKKTVYPCLDHDRFLDCGTLWSRLITLDEIIRQVSKNTSRIGNNITDDHCREIIRLTNLSKSIENKYKKIIAESLGKIN